MLELLGPTDRRVLRELACPSMTALDASVWVARRPGEGRVAHLRGCCQDDAREKPAGDPDAGVWQACGRCLAFDVRWTGATQAVRFLMLIDAVGDARTHLDEPASFAVMDRVGAQVGYAMKLLGYGGGSPAALDLSDIPDPATRVWAGDLLDAARAELPELLGRFAPIVRDRSRDRDATRTRLLHVADLAGVLLSRSDLLWLRNELLIAPWASVSEHKDWVLAQVPAALLESRYAVQSLARGHVADLGDSHTMDDSCVGGAYAALLAGGTSLRLDVALSTARTIAAPVAV